MRRTIRGAVVAATMLLVSITTACANLVSDPSLPEGVQSPTTYNSPEGARELTRATLELFKYALPGMIVGSGLLTDEFSNSDPGKQNLLDIRDLPEAPRGATDLLGPLDMSYQHLHRLRGQARQAAGVIAKYAPDFPSGMRAQLYAIEAYAELLLADVFCSGVPLSTMDFERDFTYRPGSTTAEIYEHAIILFDSALSIVGDSANVGVLARVGRGRALLALGRYDEAAQAVEAVHADEAYRTKITFYPNGTVASHIFAAEATVSDAEGKNGLPYRSSGDPRTQSDTAKLRAGFGFRLVYLPNKYRDSDSVVFTAADGIEATLIRAEAALHAGDTDSWLTMLNDLRTKGSYRGIDTTFHIEMVGGVPDSTIVRIDTLWNAGAGRVNNLGPLPAPATAEARVKLMFDERAAWLFATAHRQGDLRRLTRLYGRSQDDVYPTGPYLNVGGSPNGTYSGFVTVPIPATEYRNPHFRGCLSRD